MVAKPPRTRRRRYRPSKEYSAVRGFRIRYGIASTGRIAPLLDYHRPGVDFVLNGAPDLRIVAGGGRKSECIPPARGVPLRHRDGGAQRASSSATGCWRLGLRGGSAWSFRGGPRLRVLRGIAASAHGSLPMEFRSTYGSVGQHTPRDPRGRCWLLDWASEAGARTVERACRFRNRARNPAHAVRNRDAARRCLRMGEGLRADSRPYLDRTGERVGSLSRGGSNLAVARSRTGDVRGHQHDVVSRAGTW